MSGNDAARLREDERLLLSGALGPYTRPGIERVQASHELAETVERIIAARLGSVEAARGDREVVMEREEIIEARQWHGGYICTCGHELNSPAGFTRHVLDAALASVQQGDEKKKQ